MDNINVKLHNLQKTILKKLTLRQTLRFNELLIPGLESEHMNYHLKKLLNYGMVTKKENMYTLTDKGKDYTNLMDDQIELIEKQPKSSVLLHVLRISNNIVVEHLLNKRLRQPYFGKIGRITGKVRFGETLKQTAIRELYEETGLKAGKIFLEKVYHKLRHREDGNYIQDAIFYCFFVTEFTGKLIEKTPYQENFWMSAKDVKNKKLDTYDDLDLGNRLTPLPLHFIEEDKLAEGF